MRCLLSYSSVLLSLTMAVMSQQFPKTYTIVNKCPSTIDVYVGTTLDGTLASGASKTRSVDANAGYFYTTANGGQATKSTRVAFFDDNSGRNIYYIVKDVDNFNVGVSVVPNNHPVTNGFCGAATCNDVLCNAAFPGPPTHSFPPNDPTAPNPPLFRCTFSDVTYTITFCPTGAFPTNAQLGRPINPNFNRNKCLDVRGAVYANGTPVQIYDCNNTGAQRWVIKRGTTKVQVAGTNFCLDAGSNPASGVGMKIWQCYSNLAAQKWSFTADNKISLASQGQCLDLRNGVLTNSNQVQTWKCSNNNNNQIWTALTI